MDKTTDNVLDCLDIISIYLEHGDIDFDSALDKSYAEGVVQILRHKLITNDAGLPPLTIIDDYYDDLILWSENDSPHASKAFASAASFLCALEEWIVTQ